MLKSFASALSNLRRDSGLSQREAAMGLGVSQALLSHYENGVREPGLAFVVRACDYYGVSADYLLGRAAEPDGGARDFSGVLELALELRRLAERAESLAEGGKA